MIRIKIKWKSRSPQEEAFRVPSAQFHPPTHQKSPHLLRSRAFIYLNTALLNRLPVEEEPTDDKTLVLLCWTVDLKYLWSSAQEEWGKMINLLSVKVSSLAVLWGSFVCGGGCCCLCGNVLLGMYMDDAGHLWVKARMGCARGSGGYRPIMGYRQKDFRVWVGFKVMMGIAWRVCWTGNDRGCCWDFMHC